MLNRSKAKNRSNPATPGALKFMRWALNFISECRAGRDLFDYDIVIGGVADDKVIRTLDRYFQEEITADQALGLLKYEKPNLQYCIRNQYMLDKCLKHVKSIQL